jgi:hypothetical protein
MRFARLNDGRLRALGVAVEHFEPLNSVLAQKSGNRDLRDLNVSGRFGSEGRGRDGVTTNAGLHECYLVFVQGRVGAADGYMIGIRLNHIRLSSVAVLRFEPERVK